MTSSTLSENDEQELKNENYEILDTKTFSVIQNAEQEIENDLDLRIKDLTNQLKLKLHMNSATNASESDLYHDCRSEGLYRVLIKDNKKLNYIPSNTSNFIFYF